jgi:hypothetical protein
MTNELNAETTTGLTLYAVLLNSTGQVWNGAAFEAINGANWLTYNIAMTEAAAGIYLADMPAVVAGAYPYVVYSQAGVNPATTDTLKGGGFIQWDGSAELPLSAIEAQTDDIGVAGAGLTALGDTRLANLDATVSSRSSHSAADVWAVATRTLSSYGTLVADIWSYTTRTLTSLSALVASIAAAVWAYATRTLTMTAAAVEAAVDGDEITLYRGDTWSISLTGLGAITGYTDVWFTVKDSPTQTDAEALLLVSETVGLERLNGAEGTAAQASLVVDDESAGNITVTVAAVASASIEEGANRRYDVQWKTASGAIHTLTINTLNVNGDMTRAVS